MERSHAGYQKGLHDVEDWTIFDIRLFVIQRLLGMPSLEVWHPGLPKIL